MLCATKYISRCGVHRVTYRWAWYLGVFTSVSWISPVVIGGEWVASRSTYSHHPQTGQRIGQYSPIGPVIATPDPHVAQNGYRHIQNVIRPRSGGDSADYLHVVEQWGPVPVRPYGEWQFPYRPYSVPYPWWGPPPPVVIITPFGFGVGGVAPAPGP